MKGVPFLVKKLYKTKRVGSRGRASLYNTLLSTLAPPSSKRRPHPPQLQSQYRVNETQSCQPLACIAASLCTRLNPLYSPSANYCTKACSNILQRSQEHVSVSDRQLSYGFLMCLTIGLILTCA